MPIIQCGEPPFSNLSGPMSKMFDQLSRGYFGFAPGDTWSPNVNLYETDKAYIVCVDLAGVDKKKIDLETSPGKLTLRGARPVPVPGKGVQGDTPACDAGTKIKVHLMEIDHGPFAREVELPIDVDADKVVATYCNGLLWIELPKSR